MGRRGNAHHTAAAAPTAATAPVTSGLRHVGQPLHPQHPGERKNQSAGEASQAESDVRSRNARGRAPIDVPSVSPKTGSDSIFAVARAGATEAVTSAAASCSSRKDEATR